MYLSIYRSISLSLFHLSLCLAVYLSICLSMYLSIYRSISLSLSSVSLSSFETWSETASFNTFDFRMCFAPQRRALFRHLDFQKWSGPGVFCTFWLGNVLRATMACKFSSLIWPAGSAPAALASLLFDPPEPQISGKTQCFATFLPFRASASSFFWLFLFSDLLSSTLLFSLPLPSSPFHLSILSEV